MESETATTDKARPAGHRRLSIRRVLRWAAFALAAVALLVLFWLRGALYHRWVRFPREEAAWRRIRADRQEVVPLAGWRDLRGVLHSHSALSHDCAVPFERIAQALSAAGRDFICLSDHCDQGRADFSRQWRGLHGGVLFIPGYEMREGLMPFGVASGVVLSNAADAAVTARRVIEGGGVMFYAHPEEPRAWERPELTGMEIYNVHADFKDERHPLRDLFPDILLNLRRYPEHVVRLGFDRPTANLARWDDLNRTRHLTGIAGNDCHENTGLRGICTEAGTLRIEDTSPKTIVELRLRGLTRLLARLCFGTLRPGATLFRVQLDPYERMARFVSTHVLARELTEAAVLDSLRAGRVFVGFDLLADSTGFLWLAEGPAGRALPGEALAGGPEVRLVARSPHRCRFVILRDGEQVHGAEGRTVEWLPGRPGKYRVEAELEVLGEWTPWVFANPIELR
jgi:hypothetical protein